jgi:hypothetical protein
LDANHTDYEKRLPGIRLASLDTEAERFSAGRPKTKPWGFLRVKTKLLRLGSETHSLVVWIFRLNYEFVDCDVLRTERCDSRVKKLDRLAKAV